MWTNVGWQSGQATLGWFAAEERIFSDAFESLAGRGSKWGPAAREQLAAGHTGTAVLMAGRAVREAAGFVRMEVTDANDEDLAAFETFNNAVTAALAEHPDAPIALAINEVGSKIDQTCDDLERGGTQVPRLRAFVNDLAARFDG